MLHCLINKSQLYDDLSTFINIFKRLVITTQQITNAIQRDQEFSSPLQKINQITSQIKCLIDKYQRSDLCQTVQALTLNRFVYRLIEIISNCKIKYQNSPKKINHLKLISFFNDIEAILKQEQQVKTFNNILGYTQMSALKLITKIIFDQSGKIRINDCSENFVKNAQIINYRYHQLKLSFHSYQSCSNISTKNSMNEQQDYLLAIKLKEQKITIMNQVFSNIQARYELFKGIDIDFSYFRRNYFEAKDHLDSFQKEFSQRNELITRQIKVYHEQYQNRTKKKPFQMKSQSIKVENINQKFLQNQNQQTVTLNKLSVNKISLNKISNEKRKFYHNNVHDKKKKKINHSIHTEKTNFHSKKQPSFSQPSQYSQLQNRIQRTLIRLKIQQKIQRQNCKNKRKIQNKKTQGCISPKSQLKIKDFQWNCMSSSIKRQNSRSKLSIPKKFSINKTNISHLSSKK